VSGRYRSIAYRTDIGAPVERVWRAFTDSRLLGQWTAPGASVAPREKGRMHIQFGASVEMDAHIDVLVPGQRMRLILLPTRGMPGTDAVIIEDFLFERAPPGSVVRLLSSGIPSAVPWLAYYQIKRRQWEMALARLKVFLEKGLDLEQG
jgi:uncharacterized protein YndB with AHSA1/START domain